MKKTLKRFMSVFLAGTMLTGIFGGMNISFAASNGDFEYSVLSDGTAEITDYTGSASVLTIPGKIDGYTVTSIGVEAFAWHANITSVIIADSVKYIGDYAFHYCLNLSLVVIPDGVLSIGYGAFISCYSLTSITIPNSVTSIGKLAFSGCAGLTSIIIPSSVTSIGQSAFYYCDSLTEITVDKNNPAYSSDKNGVLFDKNKTELIQYPIGNSPTEYLIPDSVTSIGDSAFSYCNSLASVTITDRVTSIDDYAFEYCDNLTEIIIPDSVTSIGYRTFYETPY